MKLNVLLTLCILLSFNVIACNNKNETTVTERPAVTFVTVTPPAAVTAQPSPTVSAANPPTPPPSVTMRDVAAEAGLTFEHGAFQESITKDPIAMMGGGLCWLDYDNDGWLDLYVVNSYSLHEATLWKSLGGLPHNTLYHNQGDGSFTDVTTGSGSGLALRGNGCIAGDLNQDGYTDIYITAAGPNALLINQGNGTFNEIAAQAGLAAPEWNSAAAMADYNGDGLIDLYVASYIDLEKTIPEPIGLFPQDYYGLPDHLYQNQGDGTFSDVAQQAGLSHEERGLGALFTDVDLDNDLDLYVANDGNPNRLYLNQGDGTFSEDTKQAGLDDRGSGMGLSAGDYNGDGRFDLAVTNFEREYNALYSNQTQSGDNPQFDYETFHIGVQGFGQNQTGWGVTWLDLDLDGYLDLMTVQGKVPITNLDRDKEPIRFYHNRGDGSFRDYSRLIGATEIGPRLARGLAAADYDNDGDMDVAIASIGWPLTLLQTNQAQGNWLIVELSHFAPGTKLLATLPNGRSLVRELQSGSSYLSSEEPRFHLGLGPNNYVEQLTIIFPDGQQQHFEQVAANQILQLNY